MSGTEVQTLFADTISDRLLAGGTFRRFVFGTDTLYGYGMAAWDGQTWDSVAHRIQNTTSELVHQTYWFIRFEGDLYACGNFSFLTPGGEVNMGLARLNESEQRWEALECNNDILSGLTTLFMKEPQGQLFLTGYRGSICGFPEACVYRYDGGAFHEWPPFQQIPDDPSNYVGSVFEFQGYTYMSGSYRDPLGPGIATLRRWNGNAWELVPGWDTPGTLKDVVIRNDTLYLAGAFRMSQGAPGNYVTYFDGVTWNGMDGGMSLPIAPNSAAVTNLLWHDGILYAAGVFTHAGGQSMNGGLAWWDGHQWNGFSELLEHEPGDQDPVTQPVVNGMAVWRDTLYIDGYYRNTDWVIIKQVAQWMGELPTALQDDQPARRTEQLVCHPVSGEHMWMVRMPEFGDWTLRVTDLAGRPSREVRVRNDQAILSLDGLAQGVYLIEARGRDRTAVAKIFAP